MGTDVLISVCVILGMILTIVLIGHTHTRPRPKLRTDPDTYQSEVS